MSEVRWYMMRGGEAVPIDRAAVILNTGGSRAAVRAVQAEEMALSKGHSTRGILVRGVRYEVRHA